MEAGRPSRGGRKRTAEAAAPDPTHRPPSRKSRRGDAEADAAASSAPAFSRGGSKERKGDTAGSAEPTQGKRTRSAHAAMVASSAETSAGAVRDSRSVKEGKEAKKEAPGDGGKSEGRAKSRRAEKQAEIAATSSDNLGWLFCTSSYLARSGHRVLALQKRIQVALRVRLNTCSAVVACAYMFWQRPFELL